MRIILNKYWPLFIIILLWLIFASPFFLKAKIPYPSSYQVSFFPPWNAYEKFWGPVKNNAMPDVIDQIYPWRHLAIDIWKSGQIPLWNPFSFAGTPLLANYQSAVLSPFNILFFILPFVGAWSFLILLQPLLAGLFMFIFTRSLKLSRFSSVLSSIAFMFCGFITVWMVYGTLAYAILFLPLALFSLEKFYESSRLRFLVIFAFTIPLSFFSGHFQISLYFLFGVISYLIFKFIVHRDIEKAIFSLVYFSFGILMSLPQILPSLEFYLQSLRSGIYQAVEVIPWTYLLTFLAPDFLGNPVTRNDWFGHYAEWNSYIGIMPLLIALYSITNIKNKQTFFWIIIAVLSFLLAFNTPLLKFLIYIHFPVLSTSSASRIIVLFSFAVSVLAGFGIEMIIADIKAKKIKKVIYWQIISSFFFIFLWMIVFLKIILPVDKISIAKSNLILPTIIFLFGTFNILMSIFYKKLLLVAVLLLIFLTGFDMYRFSSKWIPFDNKNLVFPEVPTTGYFKNISDFRAFGNYGGEVSVYYKVPSAEGYDALYIRRYGQFIASLSDGRIKDSERSVVSLSKTGKYTPRAINILGIKYIIHKSIDAHAVWAFPFWKYKEGSFKLVYKDGKYEIYQNLNVSPRAFLVDSYKVESNPQRIIDTLFSKDFDPRKEIILEKDPGIKLNIDSDKTARITKYSPNEVEIKTESSGNSLLFISDSYYPGWRAYVDNLEVPILRSDYAFRAIPVFKGDHIVKFVYDPLSFRIGVISALAGLAALIGLTVLFKNPIP